MAYFALRRATIAGARYERGDPVPDAPSIRNFRTLRETRFIGDIDDLPAALRDDAQAKLAALDAGEWAPGRGDVEQGYDALSVKQLKNELKARDLPVSGTKPELVARLQQADADADRTQAVQEADSEAEAREAYGAFNIEQLQEVLRSRDLAVSGTKDELIDRVLEADREAAGSEGTGDDGAGE
jgi:hypothetical protein